MKIRNFTLYTFITFVCLCLVFCFVQTEDISHSKVERVGGTEIIEYVVAYNNGVYVANKTIGTSKQQIASNIKLQNLIELIDDNRYYNNIYTDCSITFDSITIGEDFMNFNNGNYIIKGKITSNLQNTNGFIATNGGNITFENASITNNGSSVLLKNIGAGNITINGGTYNSLMTTIMSTYESTGSITINSGVISSEQGYAIRSTSTKDVNITINQEINKLTFISSSQDNTIFLHKGNLRITGGEIENKSGNYCVKTKDESSISISGNPLFTSQYHIDTCSTIDATNYTGEQVKVRFGGEINSGLTNAISNCTDSSKFKLATENSAYNLLAKDGNLKFFKILRLMYNLNNASSISLGQNYHTQMAKWYYENDVIDFLFLEKNVRKGFEFLGWSFNKDSEIVEFTDDGVKSATFSDSSIIVYAIWKAEEYSVEYNGVDDTEFADGEKIEKYTALQRVTFPTPTRKYYDFTGWSIGEDEKIYSPFIIDKQPLGNIVLTANWIEHNYSIKYSGVPLTTTASLQKEYNIKSPNLNISLSNFYGVGYSVYGMYLDSEKTIPFNGEINFSPDNTTNQEQIIIGETINIYISSKSYFQGGIGSIGSPYTITTNEQFSTFISGHKKTSETKYISLKCDVEFNDAVSVLEELNNFVIDGNNHTIFVFSFNSYNGYLALLPHIKNTTIKDLNIIVDKLSFMVGNLNTINFAPFIGFSEDSNIDNINIKTDINLINTSTNQKIDASIGGAVVDVSGDKNTINHCTVDGKIIISLTNNHDINLYLGGISCFNYGAIILNSKNFAIFETNIRFEEHNIRECIVFEAGISNLKKNGKVFNCQYAGTLTTKDLVADRILLSGLVNAFEENCQIGNCFNVGTLVAKENISTTINAGVWSNYSVSSNSLYSYSGGTSTSKITESDFTNGNLLNNLNKYIDRLNDLIKQYNVDGTCDLWYYGANYEPQEKQSILVTYNSFGVVPTRTELYIDKTDITNMFVPNTERKYFFEGWYSDEDCTTKIDLTNVGEYSSLTLYAKFTPLMQVVNNMFALYVVADLLVLAGFFVCLYFFDKKKPVKFYCNGKLIAEAEYARAKTIELPNELENMLWFKDIQGQKPFIDRKMPYKALCLYTFNESKQRRMESKYYKELEEKEQARLDKAIAKAEMQEKKNKERQEKIALQKAEREKAKQERIAKAEARRQEKIKLAQQKEEQRIAKEEEKQRLEEQRIAEEEARKAQTEITIDDHITVIKKEIKVIKTKKDNNNE